MQDLQPSDRSRLVHFFSGAARLPLDGLDPKLAITRGSGSIDQLPTAHTCFNVLLLPEYASQEKLRDRLAVAIANAEGFGLQ